MAKGSKEKKKADLTQYDEFVNPNDEITFTCKHKGRNVRQVMIINPPCLILFDPLTTNFVQIPVDIPAGLEFVKYIDEVS